MEMPQDAPMNELSKNLNHQLLELRYALRNYRLTRRQPLFDVAAELDIPAPVLISIENNEPVDASIEELNQWLTRLQRVVQAPGTPSLFVPPFLRG
jgi:hypothetical protein